MTAWGTVPDWIAAVGTTAAFAAGLLLIRKELVEFRLSQQSQEAADARRVFAWPEFSVGGDTFVGEGWQRVQAGWWVHVRNGGDAPVYDCHVRLVVPEDRSIDHHGYSYPVLPPGETFDAPLGADDLGILAPEYPAQPSYGAWVELKFTDAAGIRWVRGEKGRLTRIATDIEG